MRLRSLSVHRASVWVELETMQLGLGLNVILGDNEAGKTTLSRTLEAMLFGPTPDTLAPLTREAAFDVSAEIVSAGSGDPIALRRHGQKLELSAPNAVLQTLVTPANRARFRDLYRIGHADLKRGGSFLEERGSLGHLLFAAESGGDPAALAELETRLEKRLKETTSRSTPDGLKKHLVAYKGLLDPYEGGARFQAHDACCEARARCDQRIAEQDRALATMDAELAAKRALLEGHEYHRERADARERLDTIRNAGATPDLAWASAARLQLAKFTNAQEDLAHARDAMLEAEAARNALPASSPIAPFTDEITDLAAETSAFDQRVKQLAEARRQAQQATTALTVMLDALDPDHESVRTLGAAAARLSAPPKLVKKLRALLDEGRKLEDTLTSRRAKLRDDAVERERAVARAEAESPRPCGELELARRRVGDLATLAKSVREADDALEVERRAIEKRHASLGVTAGVAIGSLPVADDATLDEAWRALDGAQSRFAELTGAQAVLEARLANKERQLTAERARLGAAPTAQALTFARAERDDVWTALTGTWTPSLVADAAARLPMLGKQFEMRMQRADACADARFADAERLGALEALQAEHASLLTEHSRLVEDSAAATQAVARAQAQWTALWGFLPLPPPKWEAWRTSWTALCDELAAHETRQHRRAQLAEQRRALEGVLAPLVRTHAPHLAALLGVDALGSELDQELGARQKHNRVLEKAQQAAELARAAEQKSGKLVAETEAALTVWATRWSVALAELPESVREDRASVERWLESQVELAHQAKQLDLRTIEARGLQEENAAFESRVHDLVARMRGLDAELPLPDGLSAKDALRELRKLAQTASARADALANSGQAVAGAQLRFAECAAMFAEREAVLRGHCAQAGLTQHATTSEIEAAIERAQAADDVLRAIAKIDPLLARLWPIGEEAALAMGDQLALQEEIAKLEDARDAHVVLRDEAVGERKQRATELAKLEATHGGEELAQALAYARAQVAAAAEEAVHAQAALHLVKAARQRATERGRALVEDASAIFAELTEREYVGLEIDRSGKEPTLVAQTTSGLEKSAHALSDGTADQIWFALRLAAVRAAAKETPFPLVLDDVLVHFDARRKRAAMKVLGRLAEELQVILFTHDDFVAHLAKEVLGEGAHLATMSRPELDPLAAEPAFERPPAPRAVLDEPAPAREQQPSTLEAGCRYVLEVLEARDEALNKSVLCDEVRDRRGVDLTPTWSAVIGLLRQRELVTQVGERRGARYTLARASAA